MRPITPQLIIETLRLLRCNKKVLPQMLQRALMISEDRSEEILNQMKAMNLINSEEGYFQITVRGIRLLQASLERNSQRIHAILSQYPPYGTIYERLKTGSAAVDELSDEIGMNKVVVDVVLRLLNWAVPDLVRNPQTGRYYLADKISLKEQEFVRTLLNVYKELSAPSYFGMRRLYIRISILRNYVCERLGLNKTTFNKLFGEIASNQDYGIELASAPIVGSLHRCQEPFFLRPKDRPYFYVRIEERRIRWRNEA